MKQTKVRFLLFLASHALYPTLGCCQSDVCKEHVVYHLSDTANRLVEDHCHLKSSVTEWASVFYTTVSPYNILLFRVPEEKGPLRQICENTNHRLDIDGIEVPLIFWADLEFSCQFNRLDKGGMIESQSWPMLGGFFIKYEGRFMSGSVLESGWDR